MMTVEEIKQALLQFSSAELASFRVWYTEFDAEVWNRQFEQDVDEGRLDSLAEEALRYLDQPLQPS